jgi:hypothetical protein
MTDYSKMNWLELLSTPLSKKTGRELDDLQRAVTDRLKSEEGEKGIETKVKYVNELFDGIEAEKSRRSERTMLRIALIGLMVTGAAALADLIPKLIDWISKLVKLVGG